MASNERPGLDWLVVCLEQVIEVFVLSSYQSVLFRTAAHHLSWLGRSRDSGLTDVLRVVVHRATALRSVETGLCLAIGLLRHGAVELVTVHHLLNLDGLATVDWLFEDCFLTAQLARHVHSLSCELVNHTRWRHHWGDLNFRQLFHAAGVLRHLVDLLPL